MSLRQFISARSLLRTLSTLKNSIVYSWDEAARILGLQADLYTHPLHRELDQPVRVVLIGAGHRGSIYADFAKKSPREMRVVGVADPNPKRRARIAEAHGATLAIRDRAGGGAEFSIAFTPASLQ